jgi:hypothetical protein
MGISHQGMKMRVLKKIVGILLLCTPFIGIIIWGALVGQFVELLLIIGIAAMAVLGITAGMCLLLDD